MVYCHPFIRHFKPVHLSGREKLLFRLRFPPTTGHKYPVLTEKCRLEEEKSRQKCTFPVPKRSPFTAKTAPGAVSKENKCSSLGQPCLLSDHQSRAVSVTLRVRGGCRDFSQIREGGQCHFSIRKVLGRSLLI